MSDQPPIFHTKLVGLSHRSFSEQGFVLNLNVGDHMLVEREPDNPYDANAIRFVPVEPPEDQSIEHLGFVAAKFAVNVAGEIAPWMDRGFHFQATIIEGGTKKSPSIELTPLSVVGETADVAETVDA